MKITPTNSPLIGSHVKGAHFLMLSCLGLAFLAHVTLIAAFQRPESPRIELASDERVQTLRAQFLTRVTAQPAEKGVDLAPKTAEQPPIIVRDAKEDLAPPAALTLPEPEVAPLAEKNDTVAEKLEQPEDSRKSVLTEAKPVETQAQEKFAHATHATHSTVESPVEEEFPAPNSEETLGSQNLTETGPRPLFNPPPRYPRAALLREQEGTVWLNVAIRSDGAAAQAHVVQTSGHALLDRAAQSVILDQWRFPSQSNPSNATVRIDFRIQ